MAAADFNDLRDFENADRGGLMGSQPCVIHVADGRDVWNNDALAFLDGPCPESVNPSIWRRSQLRARQGLSEVTDGIDQVRGLDLSHMTLVESDNGVIVIDRRLDQRRHLPPGAPTRRHRPTHADLPSRDSAIFGELPSGTDAPFGQEIRPSVHRFHLRSTRCRMAQAIDTSGRGRMGLGELERKVMDILWDSSDRPLSGREVADEIPDRAYTTVLTVLERLRRKKLVKRSSGGKLHTFSAAASRETYTASLMLEPLSSAQDRNAVLVRFANTVSPSEANVLREALDASRRRKP
jgi:predicted transcriptional regulator